MIQIYNKGNKKKLKKNKQMVCRWLEEEEEKKITFIWIFSEDKITHNLFLHWILITYTQVNFIDDIFGVTGKL